MKPFKARIRTKQWLYSLEPPVVAAVCLLAALVSDLTVFAWLTPLWFRTMDPRVLAMYGGDPAKANVQPRKLKKYMKTA